MAVPGKIRVWPEVIEQVAALTAREVEGVAGLGRVPGRRLARHRPAGVRVEIRDGQVFAEVYIRVRGGFTALEVARTVQQEVAEAVERTIGLPVAEVVVCVQDVEALPTEG